MEHDANNTLVGRLLAEGSALSHEAAAKITALRRRGKHWEKQAVMARGQYMKEKVRHLNGVSA